MQLLFISGSEIFLVLFVFVLLFGAKGIPDLARGLGKGMAEFKKVTDEIKREVSENDTFKEVKGVANEIKESVNANTHQIIEEVGDITKEVNKIKR